LNQNSEKAQLFISLSRDNMENGYFVTPDNTPLYYTVLGNGSKPLILLHGGLGDSREMMPVISELDLSIYTLILIDFRGHGKSFHGKLALNYELYANDVFGVMDQLGIAKTSITGYSDGAVTGIVMGYMQPERVKTVIAIAPDSGINGWKENVNLDAEFTKIANDAEMLNDYESLSPEPEKFPLLLERVKNLWKSPVHVDMEKVNLIKAFCWIVGSDSDEFIKLEDFELLFNKIPLANWYIFSNLKHGELTPALAKLSFGNIHVLTKMLED